MDKTGEFNSQVFLNGPNNAKHESESVTSRVGVTPSVGSQYLGGHLVTLTSQNANEAITQHLSTLLANLRLSPK